MLAKNHLNSILLINIFQAICAQYYHNFGGIALKYASLAYGEYMGRIRMFQRAMCFLRKNKHIRDSQSGKFYSMESRQDWYIMQKFMLLYLAGQV